MPSCVVEGCETPRKDRILYEFPKPKVIRNRWLKNLKLNVQNYPVNKTFYVCSSHFKDDDFLQNSKPDGRYVPKSNIS